VNKWTNGVRGWKIGMYLIKRLEGIKGKFLLEYKYVLGCYWRFASTVYGSDAVVALCIYCFRSHSDVVSVNAILVYDYLYPR
jgi:hypothetical protein